MLSACVSFVDCLGEICVKLFGFYPTLNKNIRSIGKLFVLGTLFTRFLPMFFHYEKLFCVSVRFSFLPIINRTNNNDNNTILNFNY